MLHFEPDRSFTKVKQHVQGRLGSMPPGKQAGCCLHPAASTDSNTDHRLHHFELLFIRFLHLLAHHPDFGRDVDELQLSARSTPSICR